MRADRRRSFDDRVGQLLGLESLEWRTLLDADFGDAPTAALTGFPLSYPTTLADNGARHDLVGPTLGLNRDGEVDGQPSTNANGDDLNPGGGPDDEDGISFLSTFIVSNLASTTTALSVNLQNPNSVENRLDAWIDWNRDGDWSDAGEQIFVSRPLGTIAGTKTLSVTIPQDTGTNVEIGATYARFRLSTTGGLTPVGSAVDGEVEDYKIVLVAASAAMEATVDLPPGGGNFSLNLAGANVVLAQGATQLFSVPAAGSLNSLVISGTNAGNDALTVDFSNGNPVPSGGLTFHGGAGADDGLTVQGGTGFSSVEYDVTGIGAGTFSFAGPAATLNFTGLEPATISSALGTVTIDIDNVAVDAFAGPIATIISDFAGPNMIADFDVGAEDLIFTTPTTALIILGDNDGADVVTIASVDADAPFRAALTIDGQGGADAISLNTSLLLGSATSTGNLAFTAETIDLAANISTDGDVVNNDSGSVTLSGSTVLKANLVSIDTDATTSDNSVTFNGNVDADNVANNRTLTLNAGAENINFLAAVGSGQALQAVTINNAKDVSFGSTVRTSGSVTQLAGSGTTTLRGTSGAGIGGGLSITTNSISLASAATVTAGAVSLNANNAVTINGSLSGGSVNINVAGTLTVGGSNAVDDVQNVTATAANAGNYQLNGGSVINFAGITNYTFNGGTGNDALSITNPSGSLFAPTNGIDYNGGGQSGDRLTLAGGGGAGFSETFRWARQLPRSVQDPVITAMDASTPPMAA